MSCSSDKLQVTLADGREIAVPLVWYPRLQEATPKERNDWQLLGGGLGIHMGQTLRLGFNVDKERRTSVLADRQYNGLKYGSSITYGL